MKDPIQSCMWQKPGQISAICTGPNHWHTLTEKQKQKQTLESLSYAASLHKITQTYYISSEITFILIINVKDKN